MYENEREFLRAIFTEKGHRNGMVFYPQPESLLGLGDFLTGTRPVNDWVAWEVGNYKKRVEWHEALGDDSVPYVHLATHTGILAECFGCRIHEYDQKDSYVPASALPLISSAHEVSSLKQPKPDTRAIERYFELARLLRSELGPEVPISVPDIQSPFGVASIVWEKESLLYALIQEPQAVLDLVSMAETLLIELLNMYEDEITEGNYCHWPYIWTPMDTGCWVSEDEVGIISPEMFRTFVSPSLRRLSQTFGGLYTHCCADANHQHENFCEIPDHRAMNRVVEFSEQGIEPAMRDFSGKLVLISNPVGLEEALQWLDYAKGTNRVIVTLKASDMQEAYAMRDTIEPILYQ